MNTSSFNGLTTIIQHGGVNCINCVGGGDGVLSERSAPGQGLTISVTFLAKTMTFFVKDWHADMHSRFGT